MRNIRKILTLLVLLFIAEIVFSQNIAIDEWRDHLPYGKCISLAESESKVYCATPYNVFYYDKTDNSLNRLSKVTGLSDIGISAIKYNKELNTLLIAYSDANMDLIKNDEIINISDIKRKQILGNKTINNILFIDNYAYLSCGFGIVVLDIVKEEIADTYYIGPEGSFINVLDICLDTDNSLFYAATETGIYKASSNNPNLAYFTSWTKDTTVPHPDLEYNLIEYFNKMIIVNNSNPIFDSDTLYVFDGSTWDYVVDTGYSATRKNLRITEEELIIVNYGNVDVFDKNLERIQKVWTYNPGSVFSNDAFIDDAGEIWIADNFRGLEKSWNKGWSSEQFLPNGPYSNSVYSMAIGGNDLWVVPGGINSSWGNLWNSGGLYSFIDNDWLSYTHKNSEYLSVIRDMVSVIVDPLDNKKVYAGSWGYGLFELTNGELTEIYDETNSSLEFTLEADRINVGGLCFDDEGNLWVTNSSAENVLSVKMLNGDWKSFNLGSNVSGVETSKIVIDDFNQKWILTRSHSIFVFNDNNTITNTLDDNVITLSSSEGNGALPGNYIRSIAVDNEGEVWIGTDQGVAVFYSPGDVFSNTNFDAQQILVENDGYYRPLLESESVTAIAVDGANRKWLGTDRAGVFLMSADGTEEIYNFTEDNSPLFSNSIIDIDINDDGEVFFATSKGVISYKGTAVSPKPNTEDVLVYPNPVRPGYDGVIAIKGLVANSDVKITDVSGNVVCVSESQGGQAIWDGKNLDGRKVNTGVYLVFTSNSDGSETLVTKILFVN